jgi:hypothetical protein
MSISNIVTMGFGPGGSIAAIVCLGFPPGVEIVTDQLGGVVLICTNFQATTMARPALAALHIQEGQ